MTIAEVSAFALKSIVYRKPCTKECKKQNVKVKRKNAAMVFVSVMRRYWYRNQEVMMQRSELLEVQELEGQLTIDFILNHTL